MASSLSICVLSLISDKQFGFRAGHSTSDALTYIVQLHNAIDEKSRTDNVAIPEESLSRNATQSLAQGRQVGALFPPDIPWRCTNRCLCTQYGYTKRQTGKVLVAN